MKNKTYVIIDNSHPEENVKEFNDIDLYERAKVLIRSNMDFVLPYFGLLHNIFKLDVILQLVFCIH